MNFSLIAGQWNRIGRFYDAFPAGHASVSAALQRLNRFRASSRFYAANREPGRALKTGCRLQYRSEPKLPARGAPWPAQGRAASRPGPRRCTTAERGRISARDVHDQMNACSCLILILACIVCRQAREISRIAAATDFPFDPGHIARFSPNEWKNVIPGEEITIDPARSGIRTVPGVHSCTNRVHTLAGARYRSRPVFSAPRPGFADPLPSPGSAPPREANPRRRAREKGNPSPDCPSLRLFRDKLQECPGIKSTADLPRKFRPEQGLN